MPATKFKKVLVEDCIIEIKDFPYRQTKYIQVIEDKAEATLKKLDITEMKESDICFTFDIGSGDLARYSECLQTSTKENRLKFNKRCDFIIVRKFGGNSYVYFGDLKSTYLDRGKIYKQLSASKLFFDYVVSILKHEYDFEGLTGYKPRYVCCHDEASKKRVSKGTTHVKNRPPSSSLRFHAIKINGNGHGTISFNELGKVN